MIKLKELCLESNIDICIDEIMSYKNPTIQFSKEDVAMFNVDGKEYKCQFTLSITETKKSILEFKFYLINNPKIPHRKDFVDVGQYNIAKMKSQIGVTGTGNQFKVLSSVIDSLNRYVELNEPDYITFVAEEDNRRDLYKSMIKKLIDKFRKYKFLESNPFSSSVVDGEFWLEKV